MASAAYLAALAAALNDDDRLQPLQGGNIAQSRPPHPLIAALAPRPSSPGLTGADLELAHAGREFDTADKVAQQANHDAWSPEMPRSVIAPSLARGQQAVETMQQSAEDEANIRRLMAHLLGRR